MKNIKKWTNQFLGSNHFFSKKQDAFQNFKIYVLINLKNQTNQITSNRSFKLSNTNLIVNLTNTTLLNVFLKEKI
jgi:hypothetical protein